MKCIMCHKKEALLFFLPVCVECLTIMLAYSYAQIYINSMVEARSKRAFIYEEKGKFLLTSRLGLRTITFDTEQERQKWIDDYTKETGHQLEVVKGKPDIKMELEREKH